MLCRKRVKILTAFNVGIVRVAANIFSENIAIMPVNKVLTKK
jgi:hypothetical protein